MLTSKGKIQAKALIDSGATSDFISQDYLEKNGIESTKMNDRVRIILANSQTMFTDREFCTSVYLANRTFERSFIVTKLSKDFDIVLSKKFLEDYDPQIIWSKGEIRFSDGDTITVQSKPRDTCLNFINANKVVKIIRSELCLPEDKRECMFGIIMIKCVEPNATGNTINLNTINDDQAKNADQPESIIQTVKTDGSKEFANKIHEVLLRHQSILQPFQGLPPDRPGFNFKMDMIPDANKYLKRAIVYKLSPRELEELKIQLKAYLEKGWVRPSKSEYASPILFAKKKSGALRLCCDYRRVNALTKRINVPIPNIDTMIDAATGSKYYTKLDLASGYHQLRCDDTPDPTDGLSTVQRTAIATQFGLYEWVVMPFGLKNCPAVFNSFLSHVLQPVLREGVLVYLDDIIIYSRDEQSHVSKLNEVLEL